MAYLFQGMVEEMQHKLQRFAATICALTCCAVLLNGCQLFCSHEWTTATCVAVSTCTLCGKEQGDFGDHLWQEATCDQPQTCTACGGTRGAPLGHEWQEATCQSPQICSVCAKHQGAPLDHDWQAATCQVPKTCASCGATSGEVIDHDWQAATCQDPETCSMCDLTVGAPLEHIWEFRGCETPMVCSNCLAQQDTVPGHQWTEESWYAASQCTVCNSYRPMEHPENGEIMLGRTLYRPAKLTIITSADQAAYVKLKRIGGEDVFSFFVRADSRITMEVPCEEKYRICFATGTEWYGASLSFGPETYYCKNDKWLYFDKYDYTYELNPLLGGNVILAPISATEFS